MKINVLFQHVRPLAMRRASNSNGASLEQNIYYLLTRNDRFLSRCVSRCSEKRFQRSCKNQRKNKARSLVIRFKKSQDKARQVGIGTALLPKQQQEQSHIPDQEQEQEQEQDALGSNYFSLNIFVQNGNA